jgi:hypothetical protein
VREGERESCACGSDVNPKPQTLDALDAVGLGCMFEGLG